jgi:preprotein translocase subunit SecG
MFWFLMTLIILIGAMMTVVILMQSSKGQGLSGAFGGAGGVGSMLGVRRAADVLSNATWILSGAFVVLIFAVNMFFLPSGGTQESIILKSMQEQPINGAQRPSAPPQGQQPAQQQQPTQQQQPAPQQAPPAGQQPAPAPAPGK